MSTFDKYMLPKPDDGSLFKRMLTNCLMGYTRNMDTDQGVVVVPSSITGREHRRTKTRCKMARLSRRKNRR